MSNVNVKSKFMLSVCLSVCLTLTLCIVALSVGALLHAVRSAITATAELLVQDDDMTASPRQLSAVMSAASGQ